MLNEIQLFVGTCRPEIFAVIDQIFVFVFAFFVGERDGRLLSKGRVSEHVINADSGVGEQSVALGYRQFAVDVADIVQIQVHQAKLEGVRHQFIAVESLVLEEFLLLAVKRVIIRVGDEFLCGKEEPAGTATGVGNGFHGFGAEALDHGTNQRTRREILTRTALDVFCVFLEQAFVDFAFHIR